MNNGDIQRIQHIITYCEDIAGTLVRFGQDYDIFVEDKDYFKSVSMSMMQIGALSVALSDDFKSATCDQIPWSAIKGMRNMYVHAYAAMNKEIIWASAVSDIPKLMGFCCKILDQR